MRVSIPLASIRVLERITSGNKTAYADRRDSAADDQHVLALALLVHVDPPVSRPDARNAALVVDGHLVQVLQREQHAPGDGRCAGVGRVAAAADREGCVEEGGDLDACCGGAGAVGREDARWC
jgi:hypothetical protein